MSAPTHAWLRRLSDYHSGGGIGDAERIAVEEHLATCAECQEALAMYRRFYTLLRSPLRLGGPSAHFDGTTVPLATATRPEAPTRRPTRPRDPRGSRKRRALAGLAATLAAALIIAGFVALIGPRLHAPNVGGTPTPRVSPSAQPSATPSPSGTTSPTLNGFVCANPQGSSMTYAYVRGDGLLSVVTGCAAPRQFGSAQTGAIAWSPSKRYLAVWTSGTPGIAKVSIIDVRSGTISQTPYAVDFGQSPQVGDTVRIFFGWLDDSSFLGAITTIAGNPQGFEQPGPTTLVRVDVGSGRETTLGRISGWVSAHPGRVVAHGRYLFYAGYDSASTAAYLHRFDLTTGTDTQLVSLGLYTSGGCQGTLVCGWTAPWDVSPDGAHILYHHPGAASGPSDIYAPKDTPVLYANPDGSAASTPFGSQLAASLVTPIFSPDGSAAALAGSTYAGTNPPMSALNQIKIVRFGGAPTVATGSLESWRSDGVALVLAISGPGPVLYDLATGNTTPLEAGSYGYLWGNP
ncbi:MAG TPA: zf-HC2 domain-containing protein [Ktedonobacterales bacterium]